MYEMLLYPHKVCFKWKEFKDFSAWTQLTHGLQGKGGRGTGLVFILFLSTVKYLHKVCFK